MDWITGISKAIDYIEEHITEPTDYARAAKEACSSPFNFQRVFAMLCGYTLGDYVRMRRLTLAGEELLSPELVWAPVFFVLRKGGKNVILIEESNIERKTPMRRFLKFFARLFVLLLGLSLCISPLGGFAAYNLEYEQAVGNPLKGFMPFYKQGGADNSVPYSMEWFYVPLSALMSDSGEYTIRELSLIHI